MTTLRCRFVSNMSHFPFNFFSFVIFIYSFALLLSVQSFPMKCCIFTTYATHMSGVWICYLACMSRCHLVLHSSNVFFSSFLKSVFMHFFSCGTQDSSLAFVFPQCQFYFIFFTLINPFVSFSVLLSFLSYLLFVHFVMLKVCIFHEIDNAYSLFYGCIFVSDRNNF